MKCLEISFKSRGFCFGEKEKPTFGKEGIIRSKARWSFKWFLLGLVNKGIKSLNSNIEPGQPWINNKGIEFLWLDFMCKKCVFTLSYWNTYWLNLLSFSSSLVHENLFFQ